MNDLQGILQDYLSIRRALGFKLEKPGTLLAGFVAFVKASGRPVITGALALAWATKPANATPNRWAMRLDMVRIFSRYAHTLDPRHEIPPYDLLPRSNSRCQPYIYTDAEVVSLMAAATRISDSFRGQTYRTLIGLLASTGMRVGEVLSLDRTDVDLDEGILTIRNGKFGKSREVPLHSTVCRALRAYTTLRDHRFRRRSTTPAFFVSLAGTRLFYSNVQRTFSQLVEWAGLVDRKPRRPRMHDLRHALAVRTLIDWYREGLDVERQLPVLSTYLGHVHPSHTYWYLSAVPELAGLGAQRLQESLGELP